MRSGFISSSLHRSLRRERTNKFLGFLRGEQPGPIASALDPHETVSTRNMHLDHPPPLRPEPAESTPNPASADSHTPSDLRAYRQRARSTRNRQYAKYASGPPPAASSRASRIHPKSRQRRLAYAIRSQILSPARSIHTKPSVREIYIWTPPRRFVQSQPNPPQIPPAPTRIRHPISLLSSCLSITRALTMLSRGMWRHLDRK